MVASRWEGVTPSPSLAEAGLDLRTNLAITKYFRDKRGVGAPMLTDLARLTEADIVAIEDVGYTSLAHIILLLAQASPSLRLKDSPEVPFDHLVEHLIIRDGGSSFPQGYYLLRRGYVALKQAGYADIRDLAKLDQVGVEELVRGAAYVVIIALGMRKLRLAPLSLDHQLGDLLLPAGLISVLRPAGVLDIPLRQLSRNGLYSQITRVSRLGSPAIWGRIRELAKILSENYGHELPERPPLRH